MIKNRPPTDDADRMHPGYGQEIRLLADFNLTEERFTSFFLPKFKHVLDNPNHLFEFQNIGYDKVKIHLDLNGKKRTISLHNIEKVSIIEHIPDELVDQDGLIPDDTLLDHVLITACNYLQNMVLRID